VDDDSIKYTAFQSHLGQFEFLGASFGIRSVPYHLIGAMSLILTEKEGPLIKSALAYLDDVLCYSGSIEEHFVHLRKNLQRFSAGKKKLNAKNVVFYFLREFFWGTL